MFWQRHHNPALSGFVNAFNRRHRRVTQTIYIVIAIAMIMFGLWDVIEIGIGHEKLPEFLWVRFWMTFPILGLAFLVSFSTRKNVRLDWHMTGVCLAVGICVIQMYYMFHSIGRQIAIDGLILFSVAVYFVPSMFPHQKLLIGISSMLAYYLFLYSTGYQVHSFIHATVYLGLLNVAGTIHSVSFDRSIKLNFLNNKALEKLAHTDQLTGVDNRYQFDERVNELLEYAQTEEKNVFLAIVDIDDFKQFNDYYGHLEGDNCLIQVSNVLRLKTEGEYDQCIRFGGEEFILVKFGLKENELVSWCQEVLHSVTDLNIKHESSSTTDVVSVSVGAIVWKPGCGLQRAELMAKADEALYDAKSSGRNRVVIA